MKHIKKNIRKAMALLFAAAVFAVFSSSAFAAPIDLDATGSISITFRDSSSEEVVPGGSVSIYKVADIVSGDTGLSYQYTEAFSECEAELTDLTSDNLLALLVVVAGQNNTSAITQSIGQNGVCFFDDLETGLYLVVQNSAAEGYYEVSPFLVTLPLSDGDDWIYDVIATPKMEDYDAIPTTTSSTSSTSGTGNVMGDGSGNKLPQTGQLNWPIPVLAGTGILLFFFGWANVFGGRKENR